jgi:hypothetical protein
MSARTATVAAGGGLRGRRLRDLMTNPWARPRFLWVVGIAYVVWTLLPVATAALFSFNNTRSISIWSGFSLRWYVTDPNESVLHDPDLRHAVVQSLKLATGAVLVAVPIGLAFALALDKWRGRGSGSSNFTMMFSFITPELILAVSLFLLFLNPFKFIGLGTPSQLLGLGLLAIPYAVIIVRSRLLSLGVQLEEAAHPPAPRAGDLRERGDHLRVHARRLRDGQAARQDGRGPDGGDGDLRRRPDRALTRGLRDRDADAGRLDRRDLPRLPGLSALGATVGHAVRRRSGGAAGLRS